MATEHWLDCIGAILVDRSQAFASIYKNPCHQRSHSVYILFFFSNIMRVNIIQVNVKTQVVVGDPKEKICEVVEKSNADLLVMGSHAFGPIKRYSTLEDSFIVN